MDFNKIITRIKNLVTQPSQEWDVIKNENLTVADVFTTYLIVVAAVPALATFVGLTVVGVSAPFVGPVRIGVFRGLSTAVVGYIFSLAGVYVGAFVIDKLATTFKSTPGFVNAIKLVGSASLPVWAAGIVAIIPLLSPLVLLVALYAIYIFYLGLPKLMGTPPDKVIPYLVVSAVIIIVIYVVASVVSGAFHAA